MKIMKRQLSINGRFLCQPHTGVQRFSYEILNSLDKILEKEKNKSIGIDVICYVPRSIEKEVFWKNIQVKKIGIMQGN